MAALVGRGSRMIRRLSEAVGDATPTLYRHALNRAEPWSIVGHGSARLAALLLISRAFVRCRPDKSPGSSGASPHQSCNAPSCSTDY